MKVDRSKLHAVAMDASPVSGQSAGDPFPCAMVASLASEIRYAVRGLRHSPVYTVAAVATLSLGIGANALVFAFANTLFLRPMPFVRDHELVGTSTTRRAANGEIAEFASSSIDFFAFVARNRSFTSVGAIDSRSHALMGPERPETILGATLTASMWSVLGTPAVAGRTFGVDEDIPGSSVAVISQALQERLFPGAPAGAIGQTITVDGTQRTVIGVMPRAFRPRMNPGDVWMPAGLTEASSNTSRQFQIVARLRPGVSLDMARADIVRIAGELAAERPATHAEWSASVRSLRAKIGDSARAVTLTLVAAVGFLLVLTCANVTNLAMARVARRKAEWSTRLALGAPRSSLVRNQLIEASLIGVAGGVIGVLLASAGLGPALQRLTTDNSLIAVVAMDWRVIAIVFVLSIVAGVVCAIAPSAYGLALASSGALAGGGRRYANGRGEQRARRMLMATQVSAAGTLLVGSFGAVQVLRGLEKSDIGFVPASLYVGATTLPAVRYPKLAERARFAEAALTALRETPGVRAAALATTPFLPGRSMQAMILVEGSAQTERVAAEVRRVDAEYFTVMGMPLVRGRAFSTTDRDSMPPVVIVNQSFARKYIGDAEPIGARVRRGTNPAATVVGVVPDVMDSGVGVTVGPTLYLPFAQSAAADFAFVVRSDLPLPAIDRAMRDAIKRIDPVQPLDEVAPVTRRLVESLGESRFKMLLLGVLSLLAVVIASVGIYGVTAYLIAERTREVAMRMALGAEPGSIVRAFTLDATRWVAGGAIVGLAIAHALTRLVAARAPEAAAAGVTTYVFTAVILVAVGAIAAVVPTIRASRIAPARVLRGE